VWGDHVFIEERTVDVHIRRLRQALGDDGEDLIKTVRGAGYKFSAARPQAASAAAAQGGPD
jgi:two-component system phosphate regulon response regulator PhoB